MSRAEVDFYSDRIRRKEEESLDVFLYLCFIIRIRVYDLGSHELVAQIGFIVRDHVKDADIRDTPGSLFPL